MQHDVLNTQKFINLSYWFLQGSSTLGLLTSRGKPTVPLEKLFRIIAFSTKTRHKSQQFEEANGKQVVKLLSVVENVLPLRNFSYVFTGRYPRVTMALIKVTCPFHILGPELGHVPTHLGPIPGD